MKIEEISEDTAPPAEAAPGTNGRKNKEDLTAEESLSLGDSLFVDENYADAVDCYAAALLVLRPTDGALKIRILSHRSATFHRIRRDQDALDDAMEALEVLSSKHGADFAGLRAGETELCHKRAGVAAMNLQQYEKAKGLFEKAQELANLNKGDPKAYKSYIRQCDYSLKPREPVEAAMPPALAAKLAEASEPEAAKEPAEKKKEETAKPTATSKPKVDTAPKSNKPKPIPSSETSSSSKKVPVTTVPKYQYYQNDKFMTVAILESKVNPEDLNVQFQESHLTVMLRKGGTNHTVISGNLFSEIDVANSKVNIKDEKVLVKLRKVENFEWKELLTKKTANRAATAAASSSNNGAGESKAAENGDNANPPPPAAATVPKADTSKPRPYASHRDWDKIEKEIENQEKEEKPEGDDAMNKLFQQIYASADEDTRRAMMKSYQTSGGTVLSTNWEEVKEKNYEKERTAPKGMEWKNWEGEKLPMEDDD